MSHVHNDDLSHEGRFRGVFSPPSAETTLLQTRLEKGAIQYFYMKSGALNR